MHELYRHLPPSARVLDLGASHGSFDRHACPARVVRVDLDTPPHAAGEDFVRADAASLPFPDASFAVVISNHSLEHIDRLDAALGEVRRILEPGGAFYVAVPDASTLTDGVYRWLARGGGHVNAFTSAVEVAARVSGRTGMGLRSARVLCTSLSFLNRRNAPAPRPRKLWLFGNGSEAVLRWLTWLLRLSDRYLKTRASVYGWRFVFAGTANGPGAPCEPPWTNVCVRCGAGHPSGALEQAGRVSGGAVARFRCPECDATNFYTDDRNYLQLS